jgi:hypothetical protein
VVRLVCPGLVAVLFGLSAAAACSVEKGYEFSDEGGSGAAGDNSATSGGRGASSGSEGGESSGNEAGDTSATPGGSSAGGADSAVGTSNGAGPPEWGVARVETRAIRRAASEGRAVVPMRTAPISIAPTGSVATLSARAGARRASRRRPGSPTARARGFSRGRIPTTNTRKGIRPADSNAQCTDGSVATFCAAAPAIRVS